MSLRTNEILSRYLHNTYNDVEKQIEWTKEYKKREREGIDYYFIMSNDKENLGLVRIYNIHNKTFTIGSWVMVPYISVESVLACTIMVREIAFEVLDLELEDDYDGVHVDNKKVMKYNLSWGMDPYKHYFNEKGEFVSFSLTKEVYIRERYQKLRILGY